MGGGNGKPDIFADMDKDGRFVGIEAKAYNGKVSNQLDSAYAITSNCGRCCGIRRF